MKKYLLLTIMLFAFFPLTSHAFALSFKYAICTVDESTLSEEISELNNKWVRAQRRYSRSSQYRKHIRMHVDEILSAIDDALEKTDCSVDRRVLLKKLRDDLLS